MVRENDCAKKRRETLMQDMYSDQLTENKCNPFFSRTHALDLRRAFNFFLLPTRFSKG